MARRNDDNMVDLYSASNARRPRRKKRRNKARIIINVIASLVLVVSILMLSATVVLGMRPLDETEKETGENLEELFFSITEGEAPRVQEERG